MVTRKRYISLLSGFIFLFLYGCGGRESVSISPESLFFSCNLTSLRIFLSSGQPFSYEVISTPEWLTVTPASRENIYSVILTAQVQPDVVSREILQGSLIIQASGKTFSVPVSYQTCPTLVEVYPDFLDFGEDKRYLTVSIYSLSPSPVNWVARSSENWVDVNPSSGTLKGTIQTITISVNRSYLEPGTYQAKVTFESAGGTSELKIFVTKATRAVLFFPVEEVTTGVCEEGVTIPVINIGTGKEPFTISACPPFLYPGKAWMYTGEDEFSIPLSATRLGAEPGTHLCDVTLSGENFTYTVPVKVNISQFTSDYVKFTEITPQEGIIGPSSSFSLSVSALTYIESSSTGGNIHVNAYSAAGTLLKSIQKDVPAGFSGSTVTLSLSGLTIQDWPVYVVLQLVSDSGRGVPETVLAYANPDTFAVFVRDVSFENGWRSKSVPVADFTLEFSAPVTASVEGIIYDEARNILARWASSRYGYGTVDITLPFYADNCVSYISIEGRIYDLTTGKLLARSVRVEMRRRRYSDAPDEWEFETVTEPVILQDAVERNFHSGDSVDLFEVSITNPGWHTFYVQSILPFTGGLQLRVWEDGFTAPVTSGKIYDPVYSSPFTTLYFTAPATYSISISPTYSFRGSGTEYVLQHFPGKISTQILNFSGSVANNVVKFTASVTSNAALSDISAGLYLDRSYPPSLTEIPDLYSVVDIQPGSPADITFTFPCTSAQQFNSYLRLFSPDIFIADDLAGPVSVQCP